MKSTCISCMILIDVREKGARGKSCGNSLWYVLKSTATRDIARSNVYENLCNDAH